MDLIFEPQAGEPFVIVASYFDTILEIKEKIEKYQRIPVSMQTLIFDGQTLPDDADIDKCVLLDKSHVQLRIAADFFKNLPTEEFSPAPSTVKFHVKVKTPSSKIRRLQMNGNDTVLKLKQKIQEIEIVPMNNSLVVRLLGKELQDNQMLLDCGTSVLSEIDVSLRPLRVIVLTMCGEKIPMEVNPSDKVGELRKELQKLNQRDQLPLPSEGYFFICGQNVMDDDKSFLCNQVAQGDTIEISSGSVTAGTSR
ncbi:hypothetical protein K1719_004721 [Acacia pycnantha]|nr:hypothetical protein K1719_004721 [Acacia pycnantha]